MRVRISFALFVCIIAFLLFPFPSYAAPLETRVNEAFTNVFGRLPTPEENKYWLGRVAKGEKKTFEELQGAMFFHKAQGVTVARDGSAASSTAVEAAKPTSQEKLLGDVVTLFTEIYGRAPTGAEKGWWRKRVSCGEIKDQTKLVSSMGFHKDNGVGKGNDGICGQEVESSEEAPEALPKKSSGGITRRGVAGIDSHPMGNQVRIGIHKTNGSAIHLTADGSYQIRTGSATAATLGKDDGVQVSWSDGKYHVRGSGLEIDAEEEIRIVPVGQSIIQIKSYSDPSKTFPGKNYNRFRGLIEIRKCDGCSELWAINELRTEHYLRGLAEASDGGPEEYMKSLVVAARTYVLHHRVVNGGRFHKQAFDIGSTSDDQIYRGYEYEAITPRLSQAVDQTRGVVVTDGEGDVPVSTVYFSDSDGRTRSAKEAWKTDRFPHLQRSVDDPHHVANSCRGHCVGMSAQGAYGFAKKDGWDFKKILTYYYSGIKTVKAY